VPLEILHRAAPCRSVPVTFTLCLSPLGFWCCSRCARLSRRAVVAGWPRGCEGLARFGRIEPPSVALSRVRRQPRTVYVEGKLRTVVGLGSLRR
jgi:hypothetical protein